MLEQRVKSLLEGLGSTPDAVAHTLQSAERELARVRAEYTTD